mgnify:FL=1
MVSGSLKCKKKKGLGVYKQNSESNFSFLGGMGTSILAPGTLTISKRALTLTKQNWDPKAQISKFIALVASWFAYMSMSAGTSTESISKLESKVNFALLFTLLKFIAR